ncbi:hypothetical protein FB45DRAFT_975944 [Roridomyces roridus]|uniref:Uncharacterized protein n=1 Tax=Roridomyces roridus TaxID=1738132 RepID=A0AAD7FV23_9AGAR|nr:hypothetical protein FB45DRAFT_975944 [Roridomyces roridus]
MKFIFSTVLLVSAVKALPFQQRQASVDASLVPDFGVTPGVKDPAGSASCVGINGKLIPCTCPPSRDTFIASLSANVANGHDVNNPAVSRALPHRRFPIAAPFPTDSSIASQITRMQTLLSSLQNLNGAGVGCPAVSTTFSSQLAALQAQQSGAAAPAVAAAVPATTTPATAAPSSALVDASLVPDFGVTAGVKDPAGSASCVGINGKLIPCTCPPSRDDFIASVSANVANGHDVNNPAIAAPFPTDDSIGSQVTRMQTLLSSLQNLNGAGVGCPAVSTTFSAQLAALQAKQ